MTRFIGFGGVLFLLFGTVCSHALATTCEQVIVRESAYHFDSLPNGNGLVSFHGRSPVVLEMRFYRFLRALSESPKGELSFAKLRAAVWGAHPRTEYMSLDTIAEGVIADLQQTVPDYDGLKKSDTGFYLQSPPLPPVVSVVEEPVVEEVVLEQTIPVPALVEPQVEPVIEAESSGEAVKSKKRRTRRVVEAETAPPPKIPEGTTLVKGVQLDFNLKALLWKGAVVEFTDEEFRVVHAMLTSPTWVFSRRDLLRILLDPHASILKGPAVVMSIIRKIKNVDTGFQEIQVYRGNEETYYLWVGRLGTGDERKNRLASLGNLP